MVTHMVQVMGGSACTPGIPPLGMRGHKLFFTQQMALVRIAGPTAKIHILLNPVNGHGNQQVGQKSCPLYADCIPVAKTQTKPQKAYGKEMPPDHGHIVPDPVSCLIYIHRSIPLTLMPLLPSSPENSLKTNNFFHPLLPGRLTEGNA